MKSQVFSLKLFYCFPSVIAVAVRVIIAVVFVCVCQPEKLLGDPGGGGGETQPVTKKSPARLPGNGHRQGGHWLRGSPLQSQVSQEEPVSKTWYRLEVFTRRPNLMPIWIFSI